MLRRFEFPQRGFYSVKEKVKEADFFLEKFKQSIHKFNSEEGNYYFSAYVSAARSITFSLQSSMSKYPNFDAWYPSRQKKLASSPLAKIFVKLRNHSQKIGIIPLYYEGFRHEGTIENHAYFWPSNDLPLLPEGDVVTAATEYLRTILGILKEFYRDYAAYADPRTIFTMDGLNELGWTIEDLEESLGFPRGWTDIPEWGEGKEENRLRGLRREGACDEMEYYFEKYDISE